MDKIRRKLLKSSIAGAVIGTSFMTESKTIDGCNKKQSFDEIADVVVIGSGFAGMSASLQALEFGVKVITIDKMPVFGGNSTINGGAMAVAGSTLQEKSNVEDSVQLMISDMLKAGRGMNDIEMLKLVCNGTSASYKWLELYGVKWKPFLQHFGGHSVKRVLQTIESSGAGIIRPLIKAAREKGLIMYNQTKLESFILNEDGRVIGINVYTNYDFTNNTYDKIRKIGAKKGVVVASGGFGNDISFRQLQQPSFNKDLTSTNHPGATSEVLKQLMLIGANPIQLDQIQLGPWTSPDEKGFGTASQFNTIATYPHGIVVDTRTGKRFFNELADRKTRAEAIMTRRDKHDNPVYPIGFTNAIGAKNAQTLEWGLKYNVIKKSETLDELAQHYNIPVKPLKDQVNTWNESVKAKEDKEFNRPLDSAILLTEGPWYSVRMWPKVHYCMGGVRVNKNSEVIHLITDKPIKGLYGAGEVTGGIHGASRLGGCAVAECIVTGRNAGENCADNKEIQLDLI